MLSGQKNQSARTSQNYKITHILIRRSCRIKKSTSTQRNVAPRHRKWRSLTYVSVFTLNRTSNETRIRYGETGSCTIEQVFTGLFFFSGTSQGIFGSTWARSGENFWRARCPKFAARASKKALTIGISDFRKMLVTNLKIYTIIQWTVFEFFEANFWSQNVCNLGRSWHKNTKKKKSSILRIKKKLGCKTDTRKHIDCIDANNKFFLKFYEKVLQNLKITSKLSFGVIRNFSKKTWNW